MLSASQVRLTDPARGAPGMRGCDRILSRPDLAPHALAQPPAQAPSGITSCWVPLGRRFSRVAIDRGRLLLMRLAA